MRRKWSPQRPTIGLLDVFHGDAGQVMAHKRARANPTRPTHYVPIFGPPFASEICTGRRERS